MNLSPFHDDIFTPAHHASALDAIGNFRVFKDSRANCFDQFQNVDPNYHSLSVHPTYQTTSNVYHNTEKIPLRLEDEICAASKPFSWCSEDSRPSFSPPHTHTDTYYAPSNGAADSVFTGSLLSALEEQIFTCQPEGCEIQDYNCAQDHVQGHVTGHMIMSGGLASASCGPENVMISCLPQFNNPVPASIQPSNFASCHAVASLDPTYTLPPPIPRTEPLVCVQSTTIPSHNTNPLISSLPVTSTKNKTKTNNFSSPTKVKSGPAFPSFLPVPTESPPPKTITQEKSSCPPPGTSSRPPPGTSSHSPPGTSSSSHPPPGTVITSSPSRDVLSQLTEEIFSASAIPRKIPSIRACVLQSVLQNSELNNKEDGSQFLTPIPETAPAIPSLPQELASKLARDKKDNVVKFRRAYKREKKVKEDEQKEDEKKANLKDEGEGLLDIDDDFYQQEEVKGQQINLSVYRKIRTCNEADLDKGNFAGYVVVDPSCFVGCQPVAPHRHRAQQPDEINVGSLASCKRLAAVRKVRTSKGAEVVIISPRPKYQMAGTSNKRTATPPKRAAPDKELQCNTCTKKFENSKKLFAHILQSHTQR